jgi:hypothetical protein
VEWGISHRGLRAGIEARRKFPTCMKKLVQHVARTFGQPIELSRAQILLRYYQPGHKQSSMVGHLDDERYGETIWGVVLVNTGGEGLTFHPARNDKSILYALREGENVGFSFSGDARWRYPHSVPDVGCERVSITIRQVTTPTGLQKGPTRGDTNWEEYWVNQWTRIW